jgi:NAD(P)-dependent dehydrogenase (short-subunit alcohol dehydrogenase family)
VKTWFITGASRGFGRELTEQLLARGDRVAATMRRPTVESTDRLWVRPLDVTDAAQVREVMGEAFAAMGRIDVVVSNAGFGVTGAAEELSDDQVEDIIATNLTGSIQVARAAVPHLRAQGGGRILQLSSMGGQMAFPGFAAYHATKWGIEGFYEGFAPEVAPFGIETTLIEPGMIRTSFFEAVQRAPELPVYEGNPNLRRGEVPPELIRGDQSKVVSAMIDVAEQAESPRRLLLGSDAYALVTEALGERLRMAESQKAIAHSTDID